MAKIVVVVEEGGCSRPELLRALRAATGLPFGAMADAIRSGAPLIERILFMNDHDEVAETLRLVVSAAIREGATLRLYELRVAEDWPLLTAAQDDRRLEPRTLLNILDEWDRMRRSEGP